MPTRYQDREDDRDYGREDYRSRRRSDYGSERERQGRGGGSYNETSARYTEGGYSGADYGSDRSYDRERDYGQGRGYGTTPGSRSHDYSETSDVTLNDTTTRRVISRARSTAAAIMVVLPSAAGSTIVVVSSTAAVSVSSIVIGNNMAVANRASAAGGIARVMKSPRGLVTKKPNDAGAWTNLVVGNIAVADREATSEVTSVSKKS